MVTKSVNERIVKKASEKNATTIASAVKEKNVPTTAGLEVSVKSLSNVNVPSTRETSLKNAKNSVAVFRT